ncbi:Cystathionine gamma-lyase [Tepidanaerobacter acetatoxydans Re1]|uniref:L-methionine gamma-lyase n=1 Tax=Tepidanaerobacter acetatoxydans (strain DSM 21804 / JCM 16047 / Re1) TaxID=1209989 RepID=F4LUR9_TEPAE|nr:MULTISPECIES: PLP-dependent aspartate aminotransferase family protein [Tepidanaerobacter]AEE90637.1 Cystathionine gamma-lyase [Tepidanaerobacter acetatoxydans Re1]CCP25162.1 Cystathionine gamma-lyase [Tepidanaerobacter acetatoxydans Re1]
MSSNEHKFATKAVHAGQHGDPVTGAVVSPMFMTSTYEYTPEKMARYLAGDKKGIFTYGRSRNPTQNELQNKICALSGGEAALVTASGMSAISLALLSCVHSGDHVISCSTVYSGTYNLFTKIFEELNIEVTFLEEMTEEALEKALKPNTKVLYAESVYNPTLVVSDLKFIAEWAKSKGVISMIDNTFMSPYLLRPLEYGIDVVVHSTTKYLNGHGDLIGGVIISNKDFIENIRSSIYQELGPTPSPFSCWLMLRGMKTLHIRMREHCSNAMTIAKWLEKQDKIEKVIYPGLESHPQHELAKKQFGAKGYGGMVSFVVKGGMEGATRFISNIKLAKYCVSLGDLDTMIQQPATMTHGKISPTERERMGIPDGMIRLSVGIEDSEDIIHDLEQALESV